MNTIDQLIVGGGLAGTTIAVQLHHQKKEFILIEASPRLGGKVETKWTGQGCFEFGPNSFTNKSEEIFQLLSLLGLGGDLLSPTREAKNRYILKEGKITRLPSSPQEIFTTCSLSPLGKMRLLAEFAHVPPKPAAEESVWDFFARHFGVEVADNFADPFVSGIFAGDPHKLSLADAFPTMARAEVLSGSLLRYLIGQKKTANTSPQVHQLKRGLESIFIRAREQLPTESIHLEKVVQEIVPEKKGVTVVTNKGKYQTKRLFLASPAYAVAVMVQKHLPELATTLRQIEYAPVVTAHLQVAKREKYPFAGFGLLIPSKEKRKILGVLWNSSTFPPLFHDPDHHYLTVYAGGTRHPETVQLAGERLRELIGSEVQKIFALKEEPKILHMRRHERAIPQYNLGYGKILTGLKAALVLTPQIQLAGNYIGGISMPDTVSTALRAVTAR